VAAPIRAGTKLNAKTTGPGQFCGTLSRQTSSACAFPLKTTNTTAQKTMKDTPRQNPQKIKALTSILALTCGLAVTARAQIGSGWSQITPSERFEYETNDILKTISPPPSSFDLPQVHYDNTSGVETFELKNHSSNRAEIRPNDDYSSGSRQFEADILIPTNTTTGECIHQVFNGPTGPYLLLRQNNQDSTHFTVTAGGTLPSGDHGGVIFTNTYGTWFHLNSINDVGSGMTYVYYNYNLVWSGANPGGTFYTKYGAYGTHDDAHPAFIQFQNVKLYSGGTTNDPFVGNTYEIQNVTSSKVVNQQGSLTNGSAITQWTQGTSSNLKFTFIPTSGGYYQINSVKSGLDVVVQSASTANGAALIQWSFGSAGNDQWRPVQNSDGTWTFFNLHSGLVMNNTGGGLTNNCPYSQWTWLNSNNEKFNLLKQ
jgi:hypothetical protein